MQTQGDAGIQLEERAAEPGRGGANAPLWTPSFILICFSALTTFFAFHSLLPTLPFYIKEFGGTTGMAGLALGSLTVAAVLTRPIAGWALDSYGRRLIYLGGLLLFLFPMLIYLQMITVAALIFFRFVQGIGWGICNTASGTVASDVVPPPRLGEGMGFFTLTNGISLAVAPALGLWLVDNFSFRVLFASCISLVIISLLLALPIKYHPIIKQTRSVKFVFIEKTALRPALVILFVSFTYSAFLSFLALFVREQGMAASGGIFFLVMALTTLVSRPLSGIIVDRRGKSGYDLAVIISTAATIIALPLIARADAIVHLVGGAVLYGTGFGFIQPTMAALCISKVPSTKRGGANATFWTAFDIGVAAGSVAWGAAAGTWGYATVFNLAVIPVILAALIYFFKY